MLLVASLTLSLGVQRAARSLYQRLLSNVLRAPMAFFDTTPVGRILNRFSKDTHTIDDILPSNLASYLAAVIRILGTLVVITWSTPVFCVVVVPTAIVYLLVQVKM